MSLLGQKRGEILGNLQIFKEISLDFFDRKMVTVEAKQMDKGARCVAVSCTSNGHSFPLNSASHHAYVRLVKPDGNQVFNACTIDEHGKVIVELTEQMVNVVGMCSADIMVTDAPVTVATTSTAPSVTIPREVKVVSTMKFLVSVDKSAIDYSKIESASEYNALTQLFEKAFADYTNVMAEADKSAKAAKVSETKAKASETKALQSEQNAAGSAKESQVVLDRLLACDYTRLNNDVTTLKSDIQTKATTAYVNEQIANIHQFSREIVTSLPQSGIKTNVIYMIKASKPNDHNIYDEYINVNGTPSGYELIGSTAPDLTGYAKETFVNNAVSTHNTDQHCHTDIRDMLNSKLDRAEVIDNVYSWNTDLPLSANMGRTLQQSIDSITVPTHTSDLVNDSNYVTSSSVASSINTHNASSSAHQDIRKSVSNIGCMVSVGKHATTWSINSSSYTDIGNILTPVDNELFRTVSGTSKVIIKKRGVYLVTFNGVYDNSGTPNDRVWLQLKQNGQVTDEVPNYVWHSGSLSYSKVITVNNNDYIEAALSSTSTSLKSKGKDVLQVVCLNTN